MKFPYFVNFRHFVALCIALNFCKSTSKPPRNADILLNYCPYIRPDSNSPTEADRTATSVTIAFTPTRFFDIDDVAETFIIVGIVSLAWNVPCIQNSSITELLDRSLLTSEDPNLYWWPKVAHRNSAANIPMSGESFSRSLRINLADGYFEGRIEGIFSSFCDLDLYKFPFDRQNCSVDISIAKEDNYNFGPGFVYVNIKRSYFSFISSADLAKTLMPKNGNWKYEKESFTGAHMTMDGSSVHETLLYITASFWMPFQRKPDYFLTNLYGPFLILGFMVLASFLVPAECPDRITYAATMMLSMFVLQSQVLAAVPKTSQPIIVGYYASGMICYATVCSCYCGAICSFIALKPKIANHNATFFKTWKFRVSSIIDSCAFCVAFLLLAGLNLLTIALLYF